ncbi:DNA adenine methylase [Oscillatoria sp. CS-180]|uniref:DNA adenine methylase n=1 Tax=Oscillatoria sp. CS-180 TaxID=3021720 RepID=UPI002330A353|nr:DNA adenine methylase [Oscillatoria sp. CS-180]MDB9528465.1 DNA adenine methylase [Oscillatoria sp. CS-180]
MTAIITPDLSPRPFLKWAGGKGRLIEQYRPYFPKQFRYYYEPFLGGGAIFFHLQNQCYRAVLADLNTELVNVYQCVRDDVEAVIELLQDHQAHHCHDYYYTIRAQTHLASPLSRAARLIYLNKTCFNGLYRENSKGYFNVPMGRYKNPKVCDVLTLQQAAIALQRANITCEEFTAILTRAKNGNDFVYFDPPYHPISPTSSFTSYSRYGFGARDQERLQQTFAELAERGVKVMVSNSDCPFIRQLYDGFYIHNIQATRAINSNAKRRGKISELVITSYPVTLEKTH